MHICLKELSQSEDAIVTQLTNQKPSIVPGVRPNTLPDCWISGCPRIINFTLRCFCSCGWHLDQALGPPPHITSPDTIFIFIAPLSWDKTQTWPGHGSIILPEFHPNNLTELANCNFSNLACKGFSQMLETIAMLRSSKLNRVRFLTTDTNSQIVIVYLGNNDVSEPRKEINSRDSDYCFIIIISPLPFHCMEQSPEYLQAAMNSRDCSKCSTIHVCCCILKRILWRLWSCLMDPIECNLSPRAQQLWTGWIQTQDMSERGEKNFGGQSCSHSLRGLSVSNNNTSILHSSASMTQKSSIPL